MDIKRLRAEATARAIANEIDRVATELAQMITAAVRENNRRTGVSIDAAMRTSAIKTERAVTRQTQFSRNQPQSLANFADTNPVLARILKRADALERAHQKFEAAT